MQEKERNPTCAWFPALQSYAADPVRCTRACANQPERHNVFKGNLLSTSLDHMLAVGVIGPRTHPSISSRSTPTANGSEERPHDTHQQPLALTLVPQHVIPGTDVHVLVASLQPRGGTTVVSFRRDAGDRRGRAQANQ